MKNIKLFILFIYIFNVILLQGQKANAIDLSQRLHVGDQFTPPSSVKLMRGMETKINWKALEDKVVLLDLFETSCGTCIQIMPHLQELEKKHSDIFKVLVVTPQDKQTITEFFKKNQYLKEHKVNLSVIYADNYLRKLFPYKSIPQAILLYKGKVQAITSSGFVNSENIQKLYKEGEIALPLKDDFGKASLMTYGSMDNVGIKAGVVFSGYQDGVNYQSWKFEIDSVTGLYRSSTVNSSVYTALLGLISRANLLDKFYVPRLDKVIWKVKDSTIYHNFSEKPTEVWLVDNAISYERHDRIQRPDSMQVLDIMKDFERLYGVSAYMAKRVMPCLVLKPCPVVLSNQNDKSEKLTYVGSKVLAGFLDYVNRFPPVVDEVNVDTKILLEGYDTIEHLNKQLEGYGIRGEIENREIDVMIVEEVDQ
ncbi:MAG: redoxin family protein [Sphingobacterium sp.]|jgi:thiol-disulfide isomerase/thioredoxin|nr:redoxin family protein [Sphingobacterium sp.]